MTNKIENKLMDIAISKDPYRDQIQILRGELTHCSWNGEKPKRVNHKDIFNNERQIIVPHYLFH